ncbi:MAG: hypothetical protein ACLU30_08685 [Odoribacter splanchnicus]
MMRYILIGCCFFCSLFLSSCNSTKRLGQTATQTSQLSHQLGFKVNRKDDLRLFSEAARWLGTLTAMEVAPGKESTAPGW